MRGRGIGFARYKNASAYCAVIAEVEVTEKIRLRRAIAAVDAGHTINPDGLKNQIEGGIVQAASWALKEAVRWDATRVLTRSWEDYPILRFDEVPEVEVVIVDRPGEPGLGAGECAAGPTAAAIANALAPRSGCGRAICRSRRSASRRRWIERSHSAMKLRVLLAAAAIAAAAIASAQDYPNRPLRFYVGFAPGGSTDIISRLLAQRLQERLGQPVVVEQKVGATGIIAQDAVAKAPSDGYTLVLLTGGHPTSAAMMKSLPYDPVKDFGMISIVTQYPMAISVLPDSQVKSLADLIGRAKAAPGRVSFSSAGVGSLHHLLGEWLNIEAGTEMIHVPFKGAAPAFTELLAGRIDVMIETMTFSSAQIRTGRMRPLALSTATRSPGFPDVPTIAETLPGVEAQSWLGIVTSPGTPQPVIDRLNRELRAILAEPGVQQRLAELGGEAYPTSPEEMRARIAREIARWQRVVEVRKIERQ